MRIITFGVPGLLALVVVVTCTGIPGCGVTVSEPDDRARYHYFGFPSDDVQSRNIAKISGTFSKSTWVSGVLYHVQSGASEEVNVFTVGRSPNRIGERTWIHMDLVFALGDYDREGSRVTSLGCSGHTRGGGSGSGFKNDVKNVVSRTFTGRVFGGGERIIYIEGGRDFEATSEMSIEEFAKRNKGNFLVVTMQLH